MNSYWRSVMFGVVLLVAIWLVHYFFPYRYGQRFGHTAVSLAIDAVLVFAVIPLMLKLFKA